MFENLYKKTKRHSGHNEKALQSKLPFTFQKSDWKQMVKCAANKQVFLSIVAAEQSVSNGTTALMVTEADEGRRELTSRTLKRRPGVHLWSTSGQSDKSLWSSTIILNKKGSFELVWCFLKTQTTASFYSTEFKVIKRDYDKLVYHGNAKHFESSIFCTPSI